MILYMSSFSINVSIFFREKPFDKSCFKVFFDIYKKGVSPSIPLKSKATLL
jgi:hypothetical protein